MLNVTIDDSAAVVTYSPGWAPQPPNDPNNVYFFSNTYHASETAGANITLTFSAAGIYLYGSKGPDHGNYRIQLDNSVQFLSAATSSGPTVYQQLLFGASFTESGEHTVILTNVPDDSGKTWIDFDYLELTQDGDYATTSAALPFSTTNLAESSSPSPSFSAQYPTSTTSPSPSPTMVSTQSSPQKMPDSNATLVLTVLFGTFLALLLLGLATRHWIRRNRQGNGIQLSSSFGDKPSPTSSAFDEKLIQPHRSSHTRTHTHTRTNSTALETGTWNRAGFAAGGAGLIMPERIAKREHSEPRSPPPIPSPSSFEAMGYGHSRGRSGTSREMNYTPAPSSPRKAHGHSRSRSGGSNPRPFKEGNAWDPPPPIPIPPPTPIPYTPIRPPPSTTPQTSPSKHTHNPFNTLISIGRKISLSRSHAGHKQIHEPWNPPPPTPSPAHSRMADMEEKEITGGGMFAYLLGKTSAPPSEKEKDPWNPRPPTPSPQPAPQLPPIEQSPAIPKDLIIGRQSNENRGDNPTHGHTRSGSSVRPIPTPTFQSEVIGRKSNESKPSHHTHTRSGSSAGLLNFPPTPSPTTPTTPTAPALKDLVLVRKLKESKEAGYPFHPRSHSRNGSSNGKRSIECERGRDPVPITPPIPSPPLPPSASSIPAPIPTRPKAPAVSLSISKISFPNTYFAAASPNPNPNIDPSSYPDPYPRASTPPPRNSTQSGKSKNETSPSNPAKSFWDWRSVRSVTTFGGDGDEDREGDEGRTEDLKDPPENSHLTSQSRKGSVRSKTGSVKSKGKDSFKETFKDRFRTLRYI